MKIAFFDSHSFEKPVFEEVNRGFGYEITFFEPRLTAQTAALASGYEAVCAFVNDNLGTAVLELLKKSGVRLIALRSAGFNNADVAAAARLKLPVVRVPEYSPYAVAEHAVALILALNRKIPKASARVRDHNFSLEGLVGFDLRGKTLGVLGTGRIGSVMAGIMAGFGCRVLAFDLKPDPALEARGIRYGALSELYRESDIISLHLPLTPQTHHLIDGAVLAQMKPGSMLINTSRGALLDSRALLEALKSGHLGYAGLDVYEEEEGIFFRDLSEQVLRDDVLARLLTFPNVLVTSHQGFLTNEALHNIAATTLANIREFERGQPLTNEVR